VVRFPIGESDVFLQQIVQIGSGLHPGYYSVCFGGYPPAVKGQGQGQERQATLLHLVLILRIDEALPPLLYTSLWHAQGRHYMYLLALN
jgi:hypothetical protein